ncbi:M48 family metallopeptidase [Thalassotalea ganghwensis]
MNVKIWCCCAIIALAGCAKSSTGRNQIMLFSGDDLNKMGIQSFNEMKEKQKVSTNKALNGYVQCVAGAITKHVDKSVHDGSWEVVVFDSEQINAFALPGGKIGVYSGILSVAEDQHQLAAIIGHEVAHVVEQHSNERLSANYVAQGGLVLADVFLSANVSNENKGLLMAGLGLGLQFGVVMPYSRSHESEADIIGQELMATAGFSPNAAIKLWGNMAKHSKSSVPEFMSTHPSNQTRIDDLTKHLPKAKQLQMGTNMPNCVKPK